MKTSDLLLIGGLGVAAYLVLKPSAPPVSNTYVTNQAPASPYTKWWQAVLGSLASGLGNALPSLAAIRGIGKMAIAPPTQTTAAYNQLIPLLYKIKNSSGKLRLQYMNQAYPYLMKIRKAGYTLTTAA